MAAAAAPSCRTHRSSSRCNYNGAAPKWCDTRFPATVANVAAAVVGVAVAWSLLYVNVSPTLMGVPGHSLSSMFVLYVTDTAAGQLVHEIVGFPPRFGTLLACIALQNADMYTATGYCSDIWYPSSGDLIKLFVI